MQARSAEAALTSTEYAAMAERRIRGDCPLFVEMIPQHHTESLDDTGKAIR